MTEYEKETLRTYTFILEKIKQMEKELQDISLKLNFLNSDIRILFKENFFDKYPEDYANEGISSVYTLD